MDRAENWYGKYLFIPENSCHNYIGDQRKSSKNVNHNCGNYSCRLNKLYLTLSVIQYIHEPKIY